RSVAPDQRQRGRTLEHRAKRLSTRLVGGALGQRVLDDPKSRVGLSELGAQLGDLGHRDTPVVHGEDRLGGLDLACDLVDYCCFLISIHGPLSNATPARRRASNRAPGGCGSRLACSGLTRQRGRRSWASSL